MDRTDGMRDVEVVVPGEDDGATAPGPDDALAAGRADRLRRRRRAVLRWWPLALLAVVAVVGSQVLHDARARARVEAAREQPGVVGYDVGPDLTASTPDPAALPRPGVEVDGVLVAGTEVVAGEARSVTGTDVATDELLWRTVLDDATAAAAVTPMSATSCSAADQPEGEVVCFVQDVPGRDLGDGGWEVDEPVRSWLVTLDARTGAVRDERDLAPASTAFVHEDGLVRAEVLPEVVRVAVDDLDGTPVWSTDLPRDAPDAAGDPWAAGPGTAGLQVRDGHVVVQLGMQAWSVRRSDGALEVAAAQVWVGRGGRLGSAGADGRTRLHGQDGDGDVQASGTPVSLGVDDGSAPGLDLLTDASSTDRQIRPSTPSPVGRSGSARSPGPRSRR